VTTWLYRIAGSILIVALLVGGSYWKGYKHGEASMRTKYEALVAQYTAASAKAEQQAKDEQAQADAAALAEQVAMTTRAQAAAKLAHETASQAQASADKARHALEVSHDPDVVRWRNAALPRGVRDIAAGSAGQAGDRDPNAIRRDP